MNAKEKRELLFALTEDYVIEQNKNKVWARENSDGYSIAKGKLMGACTAFEIEIRENDNEVCLLSKSGRYILHVTKS